MRNKLNKTKSSPAERRRLILIPEKGIIDRRTILTQFSKFTVKTTEAKATLPTKNKQLHSITIPQIM
jgi:hypothetical protein